MKESRSLSGYAGPRPGLRTRAGVRASLAQANIFPPGGAAWMWVTGDVGSSPAPSVRREKRGLRSSVPQGPALPTPGPQGPRAGRRRGRVPGRCKPGGWGPVARSAPGPRPPLTSAYLPRRRRRRQRRQRSKEAVGLGAQARCGSYPRRSTRMEKAGVDAQGHFVTTLLVTSRGGQGQTHGRRPAGNGIKKSSQKATPSVVNVTKGADIFKIFFRYCGPSLAPWRCQTQNYKLTLFALLLQTG